MLRSGAVLHLASLSNLSLDKSNWVNGILSLLILSTFSWNGQIFSFIYCRVCYDDDFKVREKFGVFCYLNFVITERNLKKVILETEYLMFIGKKL